MTMPITGTFIDEITWDIPSQNWGQKEWAKEFDTMKSIGIDTVVLIRSGLRSENTYPSTVLKMMNQPDLAQMLLDEAARCGIKFFFGTYVDSTIEDYWNDWEPDWDLNKKIIPEINHRYGDHPAFHGWYISSETCIATVGSVEIYKRFSNLMKEISPEKPILISPYFPSYVYRDDLAADRHRKFVEDWDRVFTEAPAIDICAFQDGSCTYKHTGPQTFELADYLKEAAALTKAHKIQNWTNVETFGRRYPIKFPPIDWRLLKKKMELAEPYAEKLITFEFSHFLSPNSIYPAAHNLFNRYKENILGGQPI